MSIPCWEIQSGLCEDDILMTLWKEMEPPLSLKKKKNKKTKQTSKQTNKKPRGFHLSTLKITGVTISISLATINLYHSKVLSV
jgi:ribosomal protein L13E